MLGSWLQKDIFNLCKESSTTFWKSSIRTKCTLSPRKVSTLYNVHNFLQLLYNVKFLRAINYILL